MLKEKERLQKRIRVLEDREGETGERLDEVNGKLIEMDQALADRDRALSDAEREIEALQNEKQQFIASRAEFETRVASLDDRIRIIGKGITPPCWYQQIKETNPITKTNWREKPYYLFDIAIRDDHMEVQSLPIPAGGAEDDGGANVRRGVQRACAGRDSLRDTVDRYGSAQVYASSVPEGKGVESTDVLMYLLRSCLG